MFDLGIFFVIQWYILNDRAYDNLSGNKDWHKMKTFVEFPQGNLAGKLLVMVKLCYLYHVFCFFHSSVALSSKMQFCVVRPEAWINTQHPTLHLKQRNFVCDSLLFEEHATNSSSLWGAVFTVPMSRLVSWLVEVVGLPKRVVCGGCTPSPPLY
jgi:hypothetical protein